MRVTLRQLQVFDAVATAGSVSRAADALGMSQSAASAALADLQIVLRRQLFTRKKGFPLRITDDGKDLHSRVRTLLNELRDLEAGTETGALSGTLTIGATAMIAETDLPRLCAAFMREHLLVVTKVQVDTVQGLMSRLERFELECALIDALPESDAIDMVTWRTDESVMVVSASHPLAGRSDLQMQDLRGFDWCMREPESWDAARLRYLLAQHLDTIRVAFTANSNWAVRHAVLAGAGIGCLSRALVQFDIDNGRLKELDVGSPGLTRTISLVRPRSLGQSEVVRAFERYLLAYEGNSATD